MNVSIGVFAHNEEKNIEMLLKKLLEQKTINVNITEILVVSSGSTDKTNVIVREQAKKNKKIKLLVQNQREGKSNAINLFLKKAKSKIIVMESADTLPAKDAVERLCSRMKDIDIGIVGSHTIPRKNKNKLMDYVVNLQWSVHHELSLEKPKFGEMIAFRKVMKEIPLTCVDEEEIASVVKEKGFLLVYEPTAIVYNKGPSNIKEFLRQRRRIYAGHLELKKRKKYKATTLNSIRILKYLFRTKESKNIIMLKLAIILELIGRLLGWTDFMMKKKHYKWKICPSTK